MLKEGSGFLKKGWISIVSGLISGLIISYFTLEYNGLTIIHLNNDGEVKKTINELDFNLITNSFLIVVASIIVISIFLNLIDKYRNNKITY